MEFIIIGIGALVLLGIIAAVASHYDKSNDKVVTADNCAGCMGKDDCKLSCLIKDRSQQIAMISIIAIIIATTVGCSTQKNTAKTRWWHSFNARYNTYYNGSLAYIDGSLEKENGNKDNYTELIPLYTVGNKNSRDLGKGNFDRAIEKSRKAIHQHSIKRRPEWDKNRRKTAKDIEWLSRREYNPFLWKAWLLMGRSQFHQGAFDEAASTFSYMSRLYKTQPAIYGKARAWLAKCYIEQGWIYDAEDVIRAMQRDSLDWRAVKEWDYTYADYYIHTGEFEKAIPYLRKVIKHEMRRKQKAREWFLMGQLEAALGHREQAYKAFRHVIRQNPPYELEFNARIAMTEVLALPLSGSSATGTQQAKKMISKLRRMALSDNNKEYLEQVYYAIGNIYLTQKDTTNAILAYEKGNEKSTRSGIEKGVLLLHLGDLYWAKEKFGDARRCYGEAIGLLDTDRDDYLQLSERAKVLDELVPYTDAIQLQDSLQALAKMPEERRNSVIDKIIADLKKKEREERRAADEANAAQVQAQNAGMGNRNQQQTTINQQASSSGTQTWYFYNPIAVSQGKTTFQRQWGKRENVDNWQRVNRTVVASTENVEELTDEMRDSLARAAEIEDSIKSIPDSAQNDPHKREYYLAQLPFTEKQVEASNKILEDGLYHAGIIFKDKLDMLPLSEKHLRRLVDDYPGYEHLDDAYYHLFLLYSRMGQPSVADSYVTQLKNNYPESQWTALLTDPYFQENAKFGIHIEDSLYAATYEAFKADRYREVSTNTHISETRFPTGANRDKFIFIGGLCKLNSGDADGCLADMKTVVEKYPDSRLSEMAGMIVNGVNAGRKLRGGKFDLGDVWSHRSYVLNDSDSIASKDFTTERNVNFMFMVVYPPDSINENQLLFELAKFNFTNFLVRNFDLNIEEADGLHQMLVTGFRNYDEALQYAREFHRQANINRLLTSGRTIIISEPNRELLGTRFSYDDYDAFYTKHFAPLKISTFHLLTEPVEVMTEKEPETQAQEPTIEEIDNLLDEGTFIDNGLEDAPAINETTTIEEEPTPEPQPETSVIFEEEGKPQQAESTIIVEEEPVQETQQGTTIILEETPTPQPETKTTTTKEPEPIQTQPKPSVPTPQQPATQPQQPATQAPQPSTPEPQPTAKVPQDDFEVYFDDDFNGTTTPSTPQPKTENKTENNNKKKPEPKQTAIDLEDEYYDLEGF